MGGYIVNFKMSRLCSLKLRTAGLRSTSTRLSILKLLEADPQRWIEGETVFRELAASRTVISMATVYRVLKDLDHHGVLLREWRIGVNGRKAVYKLGLDNSQNCEDIIVCRQCGVSVPVNDAALLHKHLRKLAIEHGFVLTEQHVTIHMICDQCIKVRERKLLHEKNILVSPKYPVPSRYTRHQKNKESGTNQPVK